MQNETAKKRNMELQEGLEKKKRKIWLTKRHVLSDMFRLKTSLILEHREYYTQTFYDQHD